MPKQKEEGAMTNQELKEHNAHRKIAQICMLTDDLYASMDKWIKYLKIGPWKVMEFNNDTVNGLYSDGKMIEEPFRYLIGLCYVGDTQFELIQYIEGPLIYAEHIEKKGYGLHHIKERIEEKDFDTTIAVYADMGIGVVQSGGYGEGRHAYLNTEPLLNFSVELGNCIEKHNPRGYIGIYPPEEEGQTV